MSIDSPSLRRVNLYTNGSIHRHLCLSIRLYTGEVYRFPVPIGALLKSALANTIIIIIVIVILIIIVIVIVIHLHFHTCAVTIVWSGRVQRERGNNVNTSLVTLYWQSEATAFTIVSGRGYISH